MTLVVIWQTKAAVQVYSLSKSFSPPQVDLREARLIDDHGATQNSAVTVRHRDPNDVSASELEYYFDVWGFMTPGDLLFYAYPLTRFNCGDGEPPLYFERWFETVDDKLDSVLQLCSDAQRATLRALLGRYSNYARDLDFDRVVQFTA